MPLSPPLCRYFFTFSFGYYSEDNISSVSSMRLYFLYTNIVQACDLRIQGCGLRVQGSGLRVQGWSMRVQGWSLMVQGCGLKVQGVWSEGSTTG